MFHYRTNLFNPSEIEHIPDCTSQWSSTNQSHSSNSNLNHHSSIIRKLPAFNKGLEQTASNMGGKTSKPLYQGTPGGSQETNQKETKGDTGQELAKEFASKLSLGPSKKEGRRHAPAQQGHKCEARTGAKERAKAGPSEKSLPGSQEVNGEADPTSYGSSADTPFHTDEVNAAVAVLTLITDICKQAPNPSIEEQRQLLAIFEQMPYLLTLEARRRYGEEVVLAVQFLTTVYDHPESVNWGAIESFDDLQLTLESLKRFGSRTEARPREGPYGEFIV